MDSKFTSLPFEEAIKFFRQKVSLPTERWTDLWEGMHSRAFVVAGAMKGELLSDLRGAVDKAIAEGTTLEEFRKSFDKTVEKHGWSYKGSRGWRTATIFNTNMRTAYATGHYSQMTDKDVISERPYWQYIGGLSADPRPEHLEWNGMVLRADDPWWKTHYPPNGWGCKCKVISLSEREMERQGLKVSKAPPVEYRPWDNPHTGEEVMVPKGIDPGWAYNPGAAAWGQQLSNDAMNGWKAQGAKAWERLTPGNWETHGRPKGVPVDRPKAVIGEKLSKEDMESGIRKVLGADKKAYGFKAGDFSYDVLVNAKTLAEHIDPARSVYLPFLPETLENPFEVWLSFEKHKGTGKVVLRQRIIKAVETGKKEGLLMVTNSVNGVMEAWTVVPTTDMKYLTRQRIGKLIGRREK